jgi:Holliday junction resolvase-like predicted endonuclease
LEPITRFLKTATNKYKGLMTEKIAVDYLKKEGFICEIYVTVANWKKGDFERAIKYDRQHYEKELHKYASVTSPEEWNSSVSPKKMWDEHRKLGLRQTKILMKGLDQTYPLLMEEEKEFELIWGPYLKQINRYDKWLRKYGHYWPDYVARNGDQIFLVEVKSPNMTTHRPLLPEKQMRALLKAKSFGLTPMLLVIPVKIDVKIGKPQIRPINT